MSIIIVINIIFIFFKASTPVSIFIFVFGCSHKGAVAVRQPYIRVVGMEDTSEANSRGPANFTTDEVTVRPNQKLGLTLSDYLCNVELRTDVL